MDSAHYALIQYCPDASRLEFFNVGLVVLCPATAYVNVRADFVVLLQRYPTLFFDHEARGNLLVGGFSERLRRTLVETPKLEVLQSFKANGANPIKVSEVRQMFLRQPDLDFQRVYERVVL